MVEPKIEIGGVALSAAECTALRVALSEYMSDMSEPDALGTDARGRMIAAKYRRALGHIAALIADSIRAQREEARDDD